MLRFSLAVAVALFVVPMQASAQFCAAPATSDAEVRRMLAERIDGERRGVGIVVGIVTPQGRRVISHGAFDQGDVRPLDGDSLFEIGSVGKVFTALVLADMVQRHEVALHDAIAMYLPPEMKLPERAGRVITLLDLATHTSALPRMPGNFTARDPADPYADYTVGQLYAFLSSFTPSRDIGVEYTYSNLGYGLLGHVLARRAGTDYETLVRSRIAAPLGLTSTVMTLPPALRARLAPGHNEMLQPVPNWNDTTMAGAGSLFSSANDLLTFLASFLDGGATPLGPAMRTMLAIRRPTGTPNLDVALAWHVATDQAGEFVWHNGGTGGYSSFVGFCPTTGLGIVVLANSEIGVDDIALHIADPKRPLGGP